MYIHISATRLSATAAGALLLLLLLSIGAHVLLLSAGVVQCSDSMSYQTQCMLRSIYSHMHYTKRDAVVLHLHVTGAIACIHALLVHVVMIQQHLRCAKCTTKQH
jgi:hypothetical protein